MLILENSPESQERPRAAFLIPFTANPINLYHFSEYFWESRQDILPHERGVIVQQTHQFGPEATSYADTLIFDATARQESTFAWQVSQGWANGQTISQLVVTPSQLAAVVYELDGQGRLAETRLCRDDDLLKTLWSRLIGLAASPEVAGHEAKLRKQKADAQHKLLRFVATHLMSVEYPTEVEGKVVRDYRHVKVQNEKYDNQYAQLTNIVKRIGYTSLGLYRPPQALVRQSSISLGFCENNFLSLLPTQP